MQRLTYARFDTIALGDALRLCVEILHCTFSTQCQPRQERATTHTQEARIVKLDGADGRIAWRH